VPHAIVLIGGNSVAPRVEPASLEADVVIAADSGLHLAEALGLTVDVVVGDFDSVDPELLAAAQAAGATTEAHPADKDATDFELALLAARVRGADSITIIGGTGGRFDHAVANVLLLGDAAFANISLRAHFGPATLTVIRDEATLADRIGSYVSLLPIGGPASGITTRGLRWNLDADTLTSGTSRGVSNEFAEPSARITVASGALLVVQPGPEG